MNREPVQTAGEVIEREEETIDLLELFYRLIEKAKYIILAALLGAVIAGLITVFLITPKYKATAKLYVMNTGESAINLSDLQIGTYLANDYQEVFKNWHVHERVIEALGLPYSYRQIERMISITNPNDTRILYITITDTDPQEAKQIADTYAAVAKEFIATTMDTKEPSLFEEALLPSAPSSPSKVRNVVIGFMLGFVLACAVVTVRFLMDDKIRSSDDVTKYLGMPTLGMMPEQGAAGKNGRGTKGSGKRKADNA
ncbi:MAG: hypothetical protein IKE30_11045 [Clostridia bacterium]|nr:hypothetical protein [Clostridia bacterium]